MAEKDKSAAPAAEEGSLFEAVEVEGVLIPKVFERSRPMTEHVEAVRAMQMRDDDVIVCAYSKSGTHWLWEVGSMLLAGKAEYENRTKEFNMMEATDVEVMQKQPSPRILNTHLPIRMLPNQVKDGKKVKVIHVYRNPKDVMVSFYFHIVQSMKSLTMREMAEMFLSEKCITGNYFTYLKEVDAFIKANPDIPTFNMSFEQMKEDPQGTVQKLAKFLQVKADDQLCADIAKACSFGKMKEADKKKELPEHFKGNLPKMYRKGEVGDWKNHLTVADSERIDAALEQLKDCADFKFRFTL